MVTNGVDQQSILLQSRDHSELLDIIDLLRSQGVSHYVPLPQLIVCGDQSSGKSSVLEAVSGVRFPTKDNLCTRFAIELILRRDPQANVAVSIVPGKDRSDEERTNLLKFKVSEASIDDFPSWVDAAKKAMGLDTVAQAFSNDVLRVEVTGPNQPNLTLVDLPGLIQAENRQQSANDVALVSHLVQSYMAESRSIILAVVAANNDYANQVVTKLARDVDPLGVRTLGIITKPDTLYVGSESEKAFATLAKNEDIFFRLGWHVLKNRSYAERDCSAEVRDEKEKSFFANGIWTTLPTNLLGLDPLKPRLSTVLRDQIITELPSLIHDVEVGISECKNRLAKLGEARGGLKEQRRYLMQVSQSFSSIVKAAVGGVYVDDFFGSAKTKEGYSKRLRAVVQAIHIDFSETMRRKGHEREIVAENNVDTTDGSSGPVKIARAEYLLEVKSLMKRSRGIELPGTFNPLIIGDLFFQQSRPWKFLVHDYCDQILEATKLCVDLILIHITDERTRAGLHREIIDPAIDGLSKGLEERIKELLKPHQKGHPITYNHSFTETVQTARQAHEKIQVRERMNSFFKIAKGTSSYPLAQKTFNTADLLDALSGKPEDDMELYACSEAIDCMEAYYKVAMKVFVDNFAVLGIEFCLLERLNEMLSPEVVMDLDDKTVQEIAAEEEVSQTERARALTKLRSLEAGLSTLRRLRRHKVGVYDFEHESRPGEEEIPVEEGSLAEDSNTTKEESGSEIAPPVSARVSEVWASSSPRAKNKRRSDLW